MEEMEHEAQTLQNLDHEAQTLQDLEDMDMAGGSTPSSSTLPNKRLIGMGCGAAGLVSIVLALVALFLPPLNLANQLRGCQALDENNPTVLGEEGISASWVGPDSLRVCLGSIALDDFLDGQGGGDFQGAAEAIPPYLAMVTPLYTVETMGDGQASIEIVLPSDAQPYEMLDLYGWDAKTEQWVFIPGHVDVTTGAMYTDVSPRNVAVFQSQPITPLLGTTLEASHVLASTAASTLNVILPTGLVLQPDGTLSGALIGGWELGQGYAVVPAVRAADAAGLSTLLNSDADLELHIEDLKTFVAGDGYDGVAIDYSNVSPADRDRFTKFIADLTIAMHEYKKMVIVVLPAPASSSPGVWDTGAYDWRSIGASVDGVVLNLGNNPADYVANGNVMNLLSWAVGEVSRVKLYLALSSYSVEDTGGVLTSISYDQALAPLGTVQATTALPEGRANYDPGSQIAFALNGSITDLTADQNTGAYYYNVNDTNGQRRVWVITASTVRARLDMIGRFFTGGVMINDLVAEGNDSTTLTAINEYKVNNESSVPSQLVMKWTVTGASGAVLDQTTGIGTPLVWQAAEAGDYNVQAQIVGGRVSDRGSVGVQIAPPPSTPTPTQQTWVAPSNTTPKPTSDATAKPTNQAPLGSVVTGGFELGGQSHGVGHPGQMHQAGMTWIKFQHKWNPGDDPGGEAGRIGQAHAQGFKVLMSVPGPSYPASIDYAGYISYLTGLAAQGVDGIEVWNEMNLDREWPASDINGASYVNNMLIPAYQAIKGVNAGILVVSGAPSPTGFFGGCGANGCDDWKYLADMRDAGAASYMDCMGIHYNEGIVSPTQTTGAADNHYTRYYKTMVDTYYSTLGKPLCFTELGYLSPAGYGALPAQFSWAGNTTVAQQAQWLAEAAVLSSQSGKVRLMIVFNVDFTVWEANDPQAGYAMLRPDGSCPACDALDAVMP